MGPHGASIAWKITVLKHENQHTLWIMLKYINTFKSIVNQTPVGSDWQNGSEKWRSLCHMVWYFYVGPL